MNPKPQTANNSLMDLFICSSEHLQAQSQAGGSSSSSSNGPGDWSHGRSYLGAHLSCIPSEMSVKEPKCCSRCWAHRTAGAEILVQENQKRLGLWLWCGHHFASCALAAEKLQYSTALSFITPFPKSFSAFDGVRLPSSQYWWSQLWNDNFLFYNVGIYLIIYHFAFCLFINPYHLLP